MSRLLPDTCAPPKALDGKSAAGARPLPHGQAPLERRRAPLLEQGVPLEDVQQLVGHADPRTTRLYDRRQRRITRNIVERISI